MQYTKELADLIEEFQKFPTIGPKSAQRMAFTLLKKSSDQVEKFLRVIKEAKENIHYCDQCFNLTANDVCEICSDPRRDQRQICVVESAKDLIALERTHEYRGLYHVLGGVISPLDGIGSDDLNIAALVTRVRKQLSLSSDPLELILAIGLSTEGEATMLYLRRVFEQVLKEMNLPPSGQILKISRLAHGLPVGADLDYADELTLAKAIEARVLC